ncbi:MAG: hypothetical protein KDB14_20555 [Planctomycetales bacterium]|nr:hypothetical protein [Planctomycetales bacterium]
MDAPRPRSSSFEQLTEEQLEAHLCVEQYGNFQLTKAVRPSYDLRVVPRQGYRFDTYRDEEAGANVPVLMASASSEVLFDLFIELLEPLGNELDVVMETSHRTSDGHQDLYREHIDVPVLKSILWDYEELLLNDGCTGIAVLNPSIPQEVQFDEHKLLIIYGEPLEPFEAIMQRHGVYLDTGLKFLTEAEHVHSSSDQLHAEFCELRTRLGMDCGADGGRGGELDVL